MGVLKYLKERICEMIFKVQEVDESNIEIPERKLHVSVAELPNFLAHTAVDEDMIEVNFCLRRPSNPIIISSSSRYSNSRLSAARS